MKIMRSPIQCHKAIGLERYDTEVEDNERMYIQIGAFTVGMKGTLGKKGKGQ